MPNEQEDSAALAELNKTIVEREQQAENELRATGEASATINDFFEPLLSANFAFRRADSSVVGPAEFLGGLAEPRGILERWPQDINVSFLGGRTDRAVVTLLVFTRREDGSRGCYRNIRLFTRRGGKWCLDFWYNYDITQP